jgi:Flp pilus assembly protein TadG
MKNPGLVNELDHSFPHKVTCGVRPHKLLYNKNMKTPKGQDLAEFAIILPLLMLIVFGVLDLGRAFFSAITIANAAREGARKAVLSFDNINNIYDHSASVVAVQQEAANSGVTLNSINIYCIDGGTPVAPPTCYSGDSVKVSVSYDFNLIITQIIGQSITINRTVEMRMP